MKKIMGFFKWFWNVFLDLFTLVSALVLWGLTLGIFVGKMPIIVSDYKMFNDLYLNKFLVSLPFFEQIYNYNILNGLAVFLPVFTNRSMVYHYFNAEIFIRDCQEKDGEKPMERGKFVKKRRRCYWVISIALWIVITCIRVWWNPTFTLCSTFKSLMITLIFTGISVQSIGVKKYWIWGQERKSIIKKIIDKIKNKK